jgi:hypothetical protein
MKFFASHDQFVADLPSDDQQDDLGVVPIHIVQHSKILHTQLKLRQRIRPEATDRFRGDRRLVAQSSRDGSLNDALFTSQKGSQLCVRFVGNGNVKRHPKASRKSRKGKQRPEARLPVSYDPGNWHRRPGRRPRRSPRNDGANDRDQAAGLMHHCDDARHRRSRSSLGSGLDVSFRRSRPPFV